MFDTVVTIPGVRLPWEKMVRVCKDLGVLSLIDGAHGIGHIDLSNLGEIRPDFFVSNCYKWLFVPRGCAILHVPFRNQPSMRTTLPTSKTFQQVMDQDELPVKNSSNPNSFVQLFQKVSTIDPTPYLCTPEALKFRAEVCGGEKNIREHCQKLTLAGGQSMAEILHTSILENETSSINQCCFVNVRLPFKIVQPTEHAGNMPGYDFITIRAVDASKIAKWIEEVSVKEYDMMFMTKHYSGALWVRISGQVYLEVQDFQWAAYRLRELSLRVERGDWM
ncbi:hypothetical protein EAE96_011123 [Botrytis aclada]|nr:hypothetical protein EAE96_011123 [Botrytis aclada]